MSTNAGLHEASSMKHDEKQMLPGRLGQAPAANGPGFGPGFGPKIDVLRMAIVQSMTLKAVVALGIPDILAKADGGKPMSAPEILAKLPTKSTPGPNSVSNLRRLMRPLVQQGVFSETLTSENQCAYGLTQIPEWYITQSKAPPMALRADPPTDHFKPLEAMLGSLHAVILDEDAIPFTVANGMNLYEYLKKHPETSTLFDKFMDQKSQVDVKNMMDALQNSGWLEGVQTFVDIGGSTGTIAGEIVARNPQIQAINFDLPHVVAGAPDVKGVRFVEGDFFKEVPSGDAMFLKNIVHNHDDEACIRILKNCFNSLPKGGKCILCESLARDFDSSPKAKMVATKDILMLGFFKGGRQRSLDESQTIMQAAGFSHFKVIEGPTGMDLILGVKE